MQTIISNKSERLDKFLSENLKVSRNQIINLIKSKSVKVNSKIISKQGLKLKELDRVEIEFPEIKVDSSNYSLESEKFKDIDIIYEDEDILILNKPSNLVIHPAPSLSEPTLVDWLKLKNFSLSTISGEQRHGIIHRLDRGTTGAIVVAKNNNSHQSLSLELKNRVMGRYYLAIIDLPLKEDIEIDRAIGRNPSNRLKMGISKSGREAKSRFIKLSTSKNREFELIGAKLFTGRTHQIRVHLNSISRHILGDEIYGFNPNRFKFEIPNSRVFLHSYILYLIHPSTKELIYFVAKVPKDMREFLEFNFDLNLESVLDRDYILNSFQERKFTI